MHTTATNRGTTCEQTKAAFDLVGLKGKRKKLAPHHHTPVDGVNDAGGAGAAAVTAGDTEAEVLVDSQAESLESWQALLAGLAEVCSGICTLLEAGVCEYSSLS